MSEQDSSPKKVTSVVFTAFPEMFEALHNLVQDAQASGAVVQIVTIWPAHIKESADDGSFEITSCRPGDSLCPKGY